MGSPDLSTPSVKVNGNSSYEPATNVHEESLCTHEQAMVWVPKLSEFVLNQLFELVNAGICFNLIFKEPQMKVVADDLCAFSSVSVSILQIYNHIKKWRTKWSVISRLKSDDKLQWSNHGCYFYIADDDKLHQYMMCNPRHHEYVNHPITNYAHMKKIFTPWFVCNEQLYQPHLLVRALNFIADNKEECAEYHGLELGKRRTWLRTWLRNQFPA